MTLTDEILTGRSEAHVEITEGGVLVHRDMKGPLILLRQAAARAGFEFSIASGFRNFEAQLRIWNQKCLGKRDLLDGEGKKLDYARLSDEEVVFSILRWSALPGASRHHWGTDIDVFDANGVRDGYKLQLVPQEAAPNGPFAKFSEWLEQNMGDHGFFRPYVKDLGGVSPEWWHISYAPIAQSYYDVFSMQLLERVVKNAEMEKKAIVLAHLPEIYRKYFRTITLP